MEAGRRFRGIMRRGVDERHWLRRWEHQYYMYTLTKLIVAFLAITVLLGMIVWIYLFYQNWNNFDPETGVSKLVVFNGAGKNYSLADSAAVIGARNTNNASVPAAVLGARNTKDISVVAQGGGPNSGGTGPSAGDGYNSSMQGMDFAPPAVPRAEGTGLQMPGGGDR